MTSSRSPLKLKTLDRQVVVITGATSGIGLSTTRRRPREAHNAGARNEEALKSVCDDLAGKGAKTAYVVADVGVEADVRAIAAAAIARFGGFDTWVNDAGVSIFGEITQTPIEDQRRLFETNYWGVVYGSLIAVEHFRERPGGGALINLGSVLGDLAIPLQGAYSASKHAVKGFTNVLRMELMREGAPVSVTLIRPSAIDTPYKDHARNLTGAPVKNPSPVYAAPLVAQAILYAAEHKTRELSVGASGPHPGRSWGHRAQYRRAHPGLGRAHAAAGRGRPPRHAHRQPAPGRPGSARARLLQGRAGIEPVLRRPDAPEGDAGGRPAGGPGGRRGLFRRPKDRTRLGSARAIA